MPVSSDTLTDLDLPWPYPRTRGKVRESLALPPDRRLLVTTDRLSAFDRVLAAIPHKGQVLNQLSAFWFVRTAGIVANHRANIAAPISHARFYLGQLIKTLST